MICEAEVERATSERIRKLRMRVMAERSLRSMGEAIIHARYHGFDALADKLTQQRDEWARETAKELQND